MGAKVHLRWQFGRKEEERRQEWGISMFLSFRASLGPEAILLSLTSLSVCGWGFMVNLCNYWANCSSRRGQVEHRRVRSPTTNFFDSFRWCWEHFLRDNQMRQRQTSINCLPLRDRGGAVCYGKLINVWWVMFAFFKQLSSYLTVKQTSMRMWYCRN